MSLILYYNLYLYNVTYISFENLSNFSSNFLCSFPLIMSSFSIFNTYLPLICLLSFYFWIFFWIHISSFHVPLSIIKAIFIWANVSLIYPPSLVFFFRFFSFLKNSFFWHFFGFSKSNISAPVHCLEAIISLLEDDHKSYINIGPNWPWGL